MSDSNTLSFHIDSDLKNRLASLYSNMAKRLGIKTAPKIVFTHSLKNAEEPFGKTAYYDPASKTVKIYITERHATDILRSFAHELIHHWQNEHNALPVSSVGQNHYAQKDQILRKREMEAYLFGNMLFRDWQDENRYGSLNENLKINDPTHIQKEIKNLLFRLIKKHAIDSFHRERTSGDMKPEDFVEELTRNIELTINQFVDTINNRGNWENQPNMIKEKIKLSELKKLIKERIDDAVKKSKKGVNNSNWAEKQLQNKYFKIGFKTPHYCWYWDGQRVVKAEGRSHEENFGKRLPYLNFRGRYDITTKELSITIPDALEGKVSGNLETDAPPKMLDSLNAEFNNPKMFYIPYFV